MCIFGGNPQSGNQAAVEQQTKQIERQTQILEQQANDTRKDAEERDARIAAGKQSIDEAFGSFNDGFFDQLSSSYINYAQPQLDDQYAQARKDITYALARKGNTRSSVAGDQFAELDKQYATNQTQIRGTGADYAARARQNVYADKNDVTNQLISTGDADTARTSALSAAKVLAVPPSFSPLGTLFTNISALAAQKKLSSDANPEAADSIGAKLFGGSSGASSGYVVR